MLPHIPPTVPLIAITAHTHPSTCPLFSFNSPDMTILLPAPLHIGEEASFGLSAPTSSTTVALALGDALALATAQKLHNSPDQSPADVFRGYHPGGAIGAAAATAAAINSAISTPSTSMTTSPSLASLEDAGVNLSFDNSATSNVKADNGGGTICTSAHFVAIDCIPTVHPSRHPSSNPGASIETKEQIRMLDILLSAIQNPSSKSWVKLSPTQIIPPRLLRSCTNTHKVDSLISDLQTQGSCISVDASKWMTLRASTSISRAKAVLEETLGISHMMLSYPSRPPHHDDNNSNSNNDGDGDEEKYIVISVVDDKDPNQILGFVAAEDIHPSLFSLPSSSSFPGSSFKTT